MSTLVSIVVPHLFGLDRLVTCIESLWAQTYSNVEIILADNGSGDADSIRKRFPDLKIVEIGVNSGFAAAVNAGAKAAKGKIVGFINDDARAHADWVVHGIDPLLDANPVAATASRILNSDGSKIDFESSGATFAGQGFQLGYGESAGAAPESHRVLFACGGGMFVRRSVFIETGGFDEDFFAYYEDVDFGWRLNVLGYSIVTVPRSIVYHDHHGTADKFSEDRRLYHMERNSLAIVFKNLADENVGMALAGAGLLVAARCAGDVNPTDWGFLEGSASPEIYLTGASAASLAALKGFTSKLPEWTARRQEIQEKRSRSDREILPLLRHPLLVTAAGDDYGQIFSHVVQGLGLVKTVGRANRVLVLTEDVIGKNMSGPGIRALELSRVLATENDVMLLCRNEPENPTDQGVVLGRLTPERVEELCDWADVVFFQGFVMVHHPELPFIGKPLVVDLYDPFHLEGLELHSSELIEQQKERSEWVLHHLNNQLAGGDFFICASEKQRDLWIGHLTGIYRITPAAYKVDPSLRALIDVVPFGVPAKPPEWNGIRLKDGSHGISEEDKVILWGGGIYEWLDPETVIRAMGIVRESEPRAKLFFLGTAHPSPGAPLMSIVASSRQLVTDLGLEDTVIFNAGWVPYDQRAGVLLDADIGVTAHPSHVETAYSFRTRVLDYFWAGLPVVTSAGDAIAKIVNERGAGLVVQPSDVEGFARAILTLLQDDYQLSKCAEASARLASEFSWADAAAPLLKFCRDPARSTDRVWKRPPSDECMPAIAGADRSRFRKTLDHLRRGEFRLLTLHLLNTVRFRLERSVSRRV